MGGGKAANSQTKMTLFTDGTETIKVSHRLTWVGGAIAAGFAAAILVVWLASARLVFAASAGVITVNPGESIQAAINAAHPGDTILISPGTYTESLSLTKPVSLTGVSSATVVINGGHLQRAIDVTGTTINHSVIISGLTVANGLATPDGQSGCKCGGGIRLRGLASPLIVNVILTHNTSPGDGGGISADYGSDLVLNNVQVLNNYSGRRGGGVYAGGTVDLIGGLFVSNTACSAGDYSCIPGGGGGLYAETTANITGTQFIDNRTYGPNGGGGGGVAANGLISITDASFINNFAGGDFGGGGLFSFQEYGVIRIHDSRFVSNSGYIGGGIFSVGIVDITGGIFDHNMALDWGGGLAYLEGLDVIGSLGITGTQFLANSAGNNPSPGQGGAIFVGGDHGASVRVVNVLLGRNWAASGAAIELLGNKSTTILHTTIVGSAPLLGQAIAVTSGVLGITDTIIASYSVGISQTAALIREDYNLFFSVPVTSTAGVNSGGHSQQGDPAFADVSMNDYSLLAASKAIDAGIDAGVSVDWQGKKRPVLAGFDIGWEEFYPYRFHLPVIGP